MSAHEILDLGDYAFHQAWVNLSPAEQSAIGAPGYERFRKLTPHIEDAVRRAERAQLKLAANNTARLPDELADAVAKALANGATEDGVALAFELRYRDRLRYSHRHGRWFAWDGARWREETTDLGFEFARQLAREKNAGGTRTATKSGFANGVERFARSCRTFAMVGDEFDADPWLLGTPAGTVDLRTGEMRRADPADLITRSTSVAPANAEPRLWREFLAQVTQGDEEMELFLRQIAGYALVGVAPEECLFFLYGPGGNGKGTFAGALHELMGDYAVAATMDTFLASRFERHSTDLAMLAGARLVIASETRGGRSWDEQRVKALTGGDPITARFMRQDNFTFRPGFSMVLFGNHKPKLGNVDDAWRRRFHIVPFTHRPPALDLTLKERLRAEYPAILRWAIDGALDWQAKGLTVPARVRAETAQYLETQDLFAAWLDERCERDPARAETLAALYGDWKKHSEDAGEYPGSSRQFGDRLEQEGIRRIKDTGGIRGRGFLGLALRP